jgi:SH3 domain-containing protein
LALALTFTATRHVVAAEEQRITNGTNVRLRAAPQSTAAIMVELLLGTELAVLAQSGVASESWLRVRTNDGREGWLLGRLTTPIDSAHYLQTIERITKEQLAAHAKVSATSFEARLQLFDLIERTSKRSGDRDAVARLALLRLYSLQDVLGRIPIRESQLTADSHDRYQRWLRAHLDESRYDEPAGSWMVDPEHVKLVHDEYPDTAVGDDIGWFYVTNGLFGECEGDVPCYVGRTNELEGWYLRTHPMGNHADDANAQLAVKLNGAMDNLKRFPRVLAEFDPRKRCGELHASLDPLRAAVSASTSGRKGEAVAAIDRFAQLCH